MNVEPMQLVVVLLEKTTKQLSEEQAEALIRPEASRELLKRRPLTDLPEKFCPPPGPHCSAILGPFGTSFSYERDLALWPKIDC